MEKERRYLIHAVLQWEKDLATEHAKAKGILPARIDLMVQSLTSENRVNLKDLLGNQGQADYEKFRNWALHQTPRQPFSSAPGELGQRLQSVIKDKEERRKKQSEKAQKNAVRRKY